VKIKSFQKTIRFGCLLKTIKGILIIFPLTILSVPPIWSAVRPYIGLGMGRVNETQEVYQASPQIAIAGLEMGRLGVSLSFCHLDQATKPQTMFPGQIDITPISFLGYLKIPISKRLIFNMGGGGSYVMAKHYIDSSITEASGTQGVRISDEIKSGFGFNAIGGIDYRVTRNFSIGANVTHLFYDTKIITTQKSVEYNKTRDYLKDFVTENPLNLDMTMIFMTAKIYW